MLTIKNITFQPTSQFDLDRTEKFQKNECILKSIKFKIAKLRLMPFLLHAFVVIRWTCRTFCNTELFPLNLIPVFNSLVCVIIKTIFFVRLNNRSFYFSCNWFCCFLSFASSFSWTNVFYFSNILLLRFDLTSIRCLFLFIIKDRFITRNWRRIGRKNTSLLHDYIAIPKIGAIKLKENKFNWIIQSFILCSVFVSHHLLWHKYIQVLP